MAQIANLLGMVLALKPNDASPIGNEPMLAEVHLNIERPLKFALRVKVGNHPESMIFLYYLNIPFRLCTNCYRLGHKVDSCFLLNGRQLEGIYDTVEVSEADDVGSQSWEDEFKVLIGNQIDALELSDARMASPVNNSPMSVLERKDIFMDAISSQSSHIESDENVSLEIIVETQENSVLGKRSFSDFSPVDDNFPPVFGTLQAVVYQGCSSFNPRPDFNFEITDAHFSFSNSNEEDEDEFYTPYRELEVQDSQAAFRMSIASSIETCSSLGSIYEEVNQTIPLDSMFEQYGSFLDSKDCEKLDSSSIPLPDLVLKEKNRAAA
ncbi:hypothetical protein MKW98_010205 [Papaver atlanticum]|uniref:Zinc knuckle CX2CX4HX4C domain-containing protein n=1 Tax=Papaver atlanticum TaxID=357466 RepID=A0AAD4SK91_9MAGN|nr:hypothetical protein MKW98_010205 [Papaver atlanticum]